jgi:hypothetical protein
MLWLPTASAAVLNVATPLPFSVPVPRLVAPSRNVTVPVGVPVPGATAVTVAVNVTFCPNTVGVRLVATTLVVLALFTTWLRLALALPL